ncbi:MAG: hypothetical protein GC147_05945 [Porphyrobacter sp.]|nr:hypothetical protein [Porphyrobacter sp.]
MANLSRPTRSSLAGSRQIPAREPARRPRAGARVAVIVTVLVAALAVVAWIDGGEEPLHPIAQPVVLPGAAA